jgi:hypothetical protein
MMLVALQEWEAMKHSFPRLSHWDRTEQAARAVPQSAAHKLQPQISAPQSAMQDVTSHEYTDGRVFANEGVTTYRDGNG